MKIIHKLASTRHEIPIDEAAALSNKAFRVVKDRDGKSGAVSNIGIGWTLRSIQQGDGSVSEKGRKNRAKYEGHEFEIFLTPETLDKWEAAIKFARQQFATGAVPEVGG